MSQRQTPNRTCRKRRASPSPSVIGLDGEDCVYPPSRRDGNGAQNRAAGALNNQNNNLGNIGSARRVGLSRPRSGPGTRNLNLSQNQENSGVGGINKSKNPVTEKPVLGLARLQKARERWADANAEELKEKNKVEIIVNLPPRPPQAAVPVQNPAPPPVALQNMFQAPALPILRPPPPQVLQQNMIPAPALPILRPPPPHVNQQNMIPAPALQILRPPPPHVNRQNVVQASVPISDRLPPRVHRFGIPDNFREIPEQEFYQLLQNLPLRAQPVPRPAIPGGCAHNLPRVMFVRENLPGPYQRLQPNNPPAAPRVGISRIPGNITKLIVSDLQQSKLENFRNSQDESNKLWNEFTSHRNDTWDQIDRTRNTVVQDVLDGPDTTTVPSHLISFSRLLERHKRDASIRLDRAQWILSQVDRSTEDEMDVLETGSRFDSAKDPVNAPIKSRPKY